MVDLPPTDESRAHRLAREIAALKATLTPEALAYFESISPQQRINFVEECKERHVRVTRYREDVLRHRDIAYIGRTVTLGDGVDLADVKVDVWLIGHSAHHEANPKGGKVRELYVNTWNSAKNTGKNRGGNE